MSDISIQFAWYDLPLIAVIIGWPGLVLGAVAGFFIWRKHRAAGAALGAVGGTSLWLGISYLFA
jgi:hypothetical protein